MKKLLLRIFLGSLCFLLFFSLVQARTLPTECRGVSDCPKTGLVPCGTRCCPCTLCDFFVMFDRIVDFILFRIVPPLAALMIAIGGFMYITAYAGPAEILEGKKGGPQMLSRAKSLFKSVALGLLIVYGAYLIVGTFLWAIGLNNWTYDIYHNWWERGFFQIECEESAPPPPSGTTPSPPGTTPPTTTPPTVTPPAQPPIAEIANISDRIYSGDELAVHVTFKNTSTEGKEFKVRLRSADGRLVDTEPDSFWRDLNPGATYTEEVTTGGPRWDIDDLGGRYTIEIVEQHGGVVASETRDVPAH